MNELLCLTIKTKAYLVFKILYIKKRVNDSPILEGDGAVLAPDGVAKGSDGDTFIIRTNKIPIAIHNTIVTLAPCVHHLPRDAHKLTLLLRTMSAILENKKVGIQQS